MDKNILLLYKEIIKNKKKINSFLKNFIYFYFDKKYKEDDSFLNEIDIKNNLNSKKKINLQKINLQKIKDESKIILINGEYIYSEFINKKIKIKNISKKNTILNKNSNFFNDNLNFFYILNKIYSKTSLLIKIPENFISEKDLYILNINCNENKKCNVFSNFYIEIKENSKININEIHINHSENIFNNSSSILNIKKNSKLYYTLQNHSNSKNINTNSIFSFQEEKSYLNFNDIFLNEQKTKNFYNFFLNGVKSEIEQKSFRNLKKDSLCETTCKISHYKSNSKSNVDFYAIGSEKSICSFKNNIFVDIDNNFINAKVKINALALSDNPIFTLTPELDINSSNIKCSHGATIGSLNEKTLIYMTSRGLSKEECVKIIIESFSMKYLNKNSLLNI